jgi:uncharacterized protein YhdP
LGKAAATPRKLAADMVLAGGKTRLSLDYESAALARLVFAETPNGLRLERGELSLGQAPLPGRDEPGLGLFVKLDELDTDAWRAWLREHAGQSQAASLSAVEINAAHWLYQGEDWGALMLAARGGGETWTGTVDCRYGEGRFQALFAPGQRPSLRLDLEALNFPKSAKNANGAKEEPAPSGEALNPAELPEVQARAKRLLWHGVDLGALELETQPSSGGLKLKKLILRKPDRLLSLNNGAWQRLKDQEETRVEGRLSLKDLGRALSEFELGDEIRATPLEARFSLAWQGAPQQAALRRAQGDIDLKLGRGGVLKLDPGLGRALGVLNLASLRRLLLLDFSDLFGKGLAYDSMEGRFHLENGQATTPGFLIDAVAAKILITGRVGLADKDFDQKVAVMPHTLASLPFAGAMVGGAALDLAQKLAGRESVHLSSSNYAIKGAWDAPTITRIEGNMPLDMLDRAWTNLKDFSGFGAEGEK